MRSVWTGILCAGLIAGFLRQVAAAQGVKIWAPSPVKAVPHKAPAEQTSVKVVTVVVTDSRRSPYQLRDWAPGIGAYNFDRAYWDRCIPSDRATAKSGRPLRGRCGLCIRRGGRTGLSSPLEDGRAARSICQTRS